MSMIGIYPSTTETSAVAVWASSEVFMSEPYGADITH